MMTRVRSGLRRLAPASAFVAVLLLGPAGARAAYPERPVTLIVPWAAGGGTDAVARILGVVLEKDLGQPVNVVNRTGGGGAVGHTAGATARPGGYTITMATVEITMMHWMGLAQIDHRGSKDFAAFMAAGDASMGVLMKEVGLAR